MKREDVLLFLGMPFIKVSSDYNGENRFYTGHIEKVTDDAILFCDIFDKHHLVNIKELKFISELKDRNGNGGLSS